MERHLDARGTDAPPAPHLRERNGDQREGPRAREGERRDDGSIAHDLPDLGGHHDAQSHGREDILARRVAQVSRDQAAARG